MSLLISSLAVSTLANPVLFFNDLFESLRREIVLRLLSCFGCLQYASSTVSSVLPSRDSILSPEAQSASPNVLCCRASTSSPSSFHPLANLVYSLFSLSLSFCALNISFSLCGRSLKGTGLSFRVLFVFPWTKLFPLLIFSPNHLLTI